MPAAAPPPEGPRQAERLRFHDFRFERLPNGRCRSRVVLSWSDGREFVGESEGVISQAGELLGIWYQFSRPSGLFIDANDQIYVADSESGSTSLAPTRTAWTRGIRVGSARTGEVWYFVPEHVSRNPSGMGGYGSMGEGVAVDAAGNVYGGEVGPIQGVTKFVPRLKR